jgi:hypothetical protein
MGKRCKTSATAESELQGAGTVATPRSNPCKCLCTCRCDFASQSATGPECLLCLPRSRPARARFVSSYWALTAKIIAQQPHCFAVALLFIPLAASAARVSVPSRLPFKAPHLSDAYNSNLPYRFKVWSSCMRPEACTPMCSSPDIERCTFRRHRPLPARRPLPLPQPHLAHGLCLLARLPPAVCALSFSSFCLSQNSFNTASQRRMWHCQRWPPRAPTPLCCSHPRARHVLNRTPLNQRYGVPEHLHRSGFASMRSLYCAP